MTKKITALRVQKRNKDRVNVYLDGEFAFGLARAVLGWLKVGQTLDEDEIARLQEEDAREVAYQRALNYLSYRQRSEEEVRQNLRKHEVPESVIEATLDKLRDQRLVDDRAFAQAWIENRCEFRPRGRRALRMELRQKGVGDGVIEIALEGVDEEPLAYRAGRKKARKTRTDDPVVFKRKLYGYLSRRGFHYGLIKNVVQDLWDERDQQFNEDRL